ncbi:MAG: GAF domain-containing protein, partial [Actinomycetota bacterium]|nr:GAF domain-containing protein [Actinomycetota bacterium]
MAADPLSAVHDRARLAAVRASALADSPAEEAFDRLAGLAALLLDAPLAFGTVVDEERAWYKSGIGLPEGADRSGPVESSFCKYVIATGEALLVDDARADPRTCANPGIDTMGVAAWAGFPVHAPSGEVLGTFCVVDTVPRHWSHRDVVILETLSKSATSEIALRALLDQERARRADA